MFDRLIHLGNRLHYPITITKLLKSPGDEVKKQETLIEYKFSWRRRISDEETVDETTYSEFDSPAEGILKEWRLEEGMVVNADMPCMTVEESCSHEVQIQGMCSLCAQDMTEINWASEERDTDRAMINMTHDQTGLMVSESVAMKAEHDAQKRLLRQRKLSLVVDLDQTIIHACIDPTVGEWQADPENPNHGAVKDVKSFQLSDDGPRHVTTGCTYYIKLRPGLQEFLEEISSMYELHVYTMGTRAYAQNIAKIVDPERKLFGNRVISRDENGSITAKSLQRLFPVSTNMVVIIDDRADVWPLNRSNLIKVVPYDFFKGIGDINSSFLPKRTDIPTDDTSTNGTFPTEAVQQTPETENAAAASRAQAAAADEAHLKVQTEEQEKTLEKQLNDRPLQHMQEELDKKDDEQMQETETADTEVQQHHRQNLLSDDDEELVALQDHLTDLHNAFYELYDRRRQERRQNQPTHKPGDSKPRRQSADDGVDLSLVPDVGDILYDLKSSVLEGLVIVLSGLVPLGVRVEDSDIGSQAQSFGAQVLDNISKRVTHLVVSSSRPRTKKVQQAAKIPSIRIVNQNWLQDCLSQWRRLAESPYYINVASVDREGASDLTEEPSDVDEETVGNVLGDFDWDAAEVFEELMGDDEDFTEGDDDDEEEEGDDENGDSEDNGDETDGTSSEESLNKGKKRKVPPSDDGEGDSEGESVLAKKQRVARNRGASGLRSAVTPNGDQEGDQDEGSSLPTPGPTTGDESQQPGEGIDEDDDLERELLAELEAAGD